MLEKIEVPVTAAPTGAEGRAFEWLEFHRDLRSAAAAAADINAVVSVILIRVGNFRTLVDQHGDEVAEKLMDGVRDAAAHMLAPYGKIYRSGKAEFGAILPGRNLMQAYGLCDALSEMLGENRFEDPALGDASGAIKVATCAGTCDPDQSMLHFLNDLSDGLRMQVDGDRLPTLF